MLAIHTVVALEPLLPDVANASGAQAGDHRAHMRFGNEIVLFSGADEAARVAKRALRNPDPLPYSREEGPIVGPREISATHGQVAIGKHYGVSECRQ